MATTVQELIGFLNEVEDKSQPIIYTYYLAEHFDLDGEQPTLEQFTKTANDLNDLSLWDEAGETINDYICGIMYREKEDAE
jgi:hypothetical protein